MYGCTKSLGSYGSLYKLWNYAANILLISSLLLVPISFIIYINDGWVGLVIILPVLTISIKSLSYLILPISYTLPIADYTELGTYLDIPSSKVFSYNPKKALLLKLSISLGSILKYSLITDGSILSPLLLSYYSLIIVVVSIVSNCIPLIILNGLSA